MTSRPNGASAFIDSSNTRPPAISKHRVDALAAVGLDQRAREVVRVDVDRRVGAELERERRASPRVEAVAITRPGAHVAPELDGQRADAAGRGVHDHALALRPACADVRYRCQAVRPCSSSASAVASLTSSSIGNVVASSAATYSA